MFNTIYIIGFAAFLICSALPYKESGKKRQDDGNKGRLVSDQQEISPRSFLTNKRWQWPMGVIPYEIDSSFSHQQKSMILRAAQVFSEISCVRWVPWTREHDRVKIVRTQVHTDCYAFIGRLGGVQTIHLGDSCFLDSMKGTLEHEMMHAMGFIHEHQRPDRDCHVRVDRTDVFGSGQTNFAIYNRERTDDNFPYDINSIMHYPNIRSVRGEVAGNSFGVLTPLDIMKINNMYCGAPNYCMLYPYDCRKFSEKCKP